METYSLRDDPDIYRLIFENQLDAVSVLDQNLNYAAVNPSFLQMTGFSEQEILGRNLNDLKGDDSQAPAVLKTKIPVDGVGRSFMLRKRQPGVSSDDPSITINKHYTYTAIAPILKDGEAVGTVASFKILENVRRSIEEYDRSLRQMKNQLSSLHSAHRGFRDIIGESDEIRKTIALAQKIASSAANVLLLGESGTGKEIFAQAVHNASGRARQPFVTLNCPALPETLVESELFGYEDGAFSGAAKGGKTGLFSIADSGTMFLDEIGDLAPSLQAKLLRVLEDGRFMQIGGRKPISSNVRIISATNQDIEDKIQKRLFRGDLFYRLCVVPIEIPPLRRRKEDIPILARYFLTVFSGTGRHFSGDCLAHLQDYPWPGNVRELRNTIQAMVHITDSVELRPEHLPERLFSELSADSAPPVLRVPEPSLSMSALQRRIIAAKLKEYGDGGQAKKRIAEEMGISLSTLYNKIRRYKTEVQNIAETGTERG
ncbi:MAG: sigma 54-interacting transcriptional regulator [Gracilibacteraceae bacterium]|jgi:transcriptional regulator with PAS, ATPase and Fis domain|nr:sigma 54-interacting transcriptional regulator [Gracilibacteraceae bacterium]